MKSLRLILLLALMPSILFAKKHYWQQDLQYFIDVKVDTNDHKLEAHQVLIYKNNSPDVLNELYIHVYPNAYANKKTAYAKQQLENGSLSFQKAKPEEMGYVEGLDFQVLDTFTYNNSVNQHDLNGKALKWGFTKDLDIVKVDLSDRPLQPGDSMIIYTPFQVKLPHVFSRKGHAEGVYHVSQWFPKPAVYDEKGWHPMPYLDQGEFYGEFARFEVNIEVPGDYVVLATGAVDPKEKNWMMRKAKGEKDSLEKETKRVHYSANQVHDFAWFASDQWHLKHQDWQKPDGEVIDVWTAALDQKEWKKAAQWTQETLAYLSEEVGTYPYPQVTVVEGGLGAGGGMEYPMITVIQKGMKGDLLQKVIIHEVGHNWFYGVLASNERAYPWMDESINSFYEKRISIKYAEEGSADILERLEDGLLESLIRSRSKTKHSQAITNHSEDFTDLNYGLDVYEKGPRMMEYLAAFLGEDDFKKMMQDYYQEWQFKHPQPEDLQKSWTTSTKKDITWFFQWIDHHQIGDVQIKKQGSKQVKLVNNTGIARFPISLSSTPDSTEVQWFQFSGKDTIVALSNTEKVWNVGLAIDQNLINNSTQNKLALRGFGGFNLQHKEVIYALPIMGGNAHDGYMLGLGFHNYTLESKKLEFNVLPFYAFKSKNWTGQAAFRYHIWSASDFAERISLGFKGASYHFKSFEINQQSYFQRFVKASPFLEIQLKKAHPRSLWDQSVKVQFDYIREQAFNYEFDVSSDAFRPTEKYWKDENYLSLKYQGTYAHPLSPLNFMAKAQGNDRLLRLSASAEWTIPYLLKKQKAQIRWFGGMMWYNSDAYAYLPVKYQWASTYTSDHDFTYEDIFLARGERTSFIQNQVAMREGGFKTSSGWYHQPIGTSDSWITAVNLNFNIPKLHLPIRVYADLSVYPDPNDGEINTSYALGIELYAGEIASVYFPILLSQDFKDYKQYILANKYGRLISFKLDLNALHVSKMKNKLF